MISEQRNIQAQVLAEIADNTRDLVYFYTRNVPRENWSRTFELDGKKFNSISWQLSHLCWAQNFLLLQATGGPAVNKPWFDRFGIGKEASSEFEHTDEIMNTLKEVHTVALGHIRSLTDEELEKQNALGMKFRFGESKKSIISHHIRHEGTHIGQLAWLAKMHGVKTI